MTVPVGVLALGSSITGLLLIPGVWHPFEDWLETAVEPLVHPSTGQEWLTSAVAVGLALDGSFLAWRAFRAGRELVAEGPVRTTLEHKLWFDELYDAVFYKPAVFVTTLFRRGIEEPLIGGSITGVTVGARGAGGVLGEAQTGYLRSYALAIAGAVAVLVVVFISVR